MSIAVYVEKEKLLTELANQMSKLTYYDNKIFSLKDRAIMLIKKFFGENSDYAEKIDKIRFSPLMTTSNTTDKARIDAYEWGKTRFIETIQLMIEDLQLSTNFNREHSNHEKNHTYEISKKIFLVHGHNEEVKQSVARFIERIDHEPIILHEQASQGRTIIEKFTINSDVALAIVLLTADDLGITKLGDFKNAKLRARQNVIFELGFFLGKLGRERVIVLHDVAEDFEFPSDYQGVIYIPYDNAGSWRFNILKEMKAAGYKVDANAIL